jgi:AraC family transcriptional regulator
MHVEIVERAPATVACLRHVGPYGPAIGHFWDDTYAPWAAQNNLGIGHARYGIGHDNPAMTPPERCRYDACAEVPPDFLPSPPAFLSVIPGGRYAVAQFKGTAAEIGAAWMMLLREWLPASRLRHGQGLSFEYYPRGAFFDTARDIFACELCVPVVPR